MRISSTNIPKMFTLFNKNTNLSHIKNISSPLKYSFSTYNNNTTAPPKQQFSKHFLIRITYKNHNDAYYETYPLRQQFRKQIKQLQDTNKCYIFGGDNFPLQSTQLVINTDDKLLIQNFLNQNAYSEKGLIQKFQIQEVQKISEDKMKKLSYFYQYL